jgi:hypothetical protein
MGAEVLDASGMLRPLGAMETFDPSMLRPVAAMEALDPGVFRPLAAVVKALYPSVLDMLAARFARRPMAENGVVRSGGRDLGA